MAFNCIASPLFDRGYLRGVSPRTRVFSLVVLAAAVASGVVVISVLATRSDVPAPKLRPGRPPLALDLGLRTDLEARILERAQGLYNRGQPRRAATALRSRHSLEAQVGAALADWPDGSLERLQALAASHPRSALVALHLGLALYWSHRDAEAETAWRAATEVQPDTPYAVRAADFLHPRFAPGLPVFVPSFPTPLRIRVLAPRLQVLAIARAAENGGPEAKILYGVALQRLGHPGSAEAQFAAAAHLAPKDAEARAAAAVGLFDKADPALAFGRLGPLVRTFPHAQTVRFHLGLLLLWMAQVNQARKELRLAQAENPKSLLGRQASAYLGALRSIGTR
jgi:tetratricopeptide (TPR) repeat protein